MMTKPTKYQTQIFQQATNICKNFRVFECLQAAGHSMAAVQNNDAESVLYVNVDDIARNLTLVHRDGAQASQSGKHWAVELHGKVFDNLHPYGEDLSQWLSNFYYINNKDESIHSLEMHHLHRWSHKDLLDYFEEQGLDKRGNRQ